MTCEELHAILDDFTAGTLTAEVTATVRTHFGSCPNCHTVAQTYHFTIRVTRALPKCEPLSAAFEQRLRAKLAEQPSA